MTRERIEDMREVVLPFVKKRLLETNYENLGGSDAEEFAREFNEILDSAIKALEQESRWIPTSERQPEENGNYLAFYRSSDGTVTLEFMMVDHCNAGGGWLHEESGRKSYKKVIAWMSLPKPYEPQKSEE